jgi:hypothetical protein
MLIGIDFDNTIVCYDQIFHTVARERDLIPTDIPVNKGAVRDHLRRVGQERLWTKMQGYVYGPALARAEPFSGVWEFISGCAARGADVCIISHKTRHPYEGPAYDLHASALDWLQRHAAAHAVKLDVGRNIFLEPTKAAKLARIGALGCDWFIDDLPEFLAEPGFPPKAGRILFDPTGAVDVPAAVRAAASWADIERGLFGVEPWNRGHA